MSDRLAPLEELRGFLKASDNWTQDTRNWPDPTEPRASHPPEPKGCTCAEGQKLDCPVHGLNADPDANPLDHSWSVPQGHPVAYPQDAPRNWSQAVSHAQDTNIPANQLAYQQNQLDTNIQQSFLARGIQEHESFQPRHHQRNAQLDSNQIVDSLDPSVVVLNSESKVMEGLTHLDDMEGSLSLFSPRQALVLPQDESNQEIAHAGNTSSIQFSGSRIHSFSPKQGLDDGPPVFTEVLANDENKNANDDAIQDPEPTTHKNSKDQDHPGQEVENTKLHVTSVAHQSSEVKPWKVGKYGKGIIDGDTVITWRIKNGWNGKPHHDKMRKILGIKHLTVDFHIDKDGTFYFHETGDCKPPNDPADSAKLVEAHDMDLEWGHKSVEAMERTTHKEGSTQDKSIDGGITDLFNMIGSMQQEKKPRKLAIRRNEHGQMDYIEEIF